MSPTRDRPDEELPLERTRKVDEDVRGELEFHMERRVAELIANGQSPEQARMAALSLFGDRAAVEAECLEIESRRRATRRRAAHWSEFRQDVSVGLRLLRKSPGFTLAALATLALGVGATTSVFSIVDQVLLRPLPYQEPDRLVDMVERHAQGYGSLSWSNFLDLQRGMRSVTAMAAYGAGTATVLGADAPMRTELASISAEFFRVFPVVPVAGRLPLPEEHQLGAAPVAVVSHGFWRDHLGAPASLAGVRVMLDRAYDVVGVLPPAFDFPARSQLWTPLELEGQSMSRTSHNWDVAARLSAGVTVAGATREADALLARMAAQFSPDFDAVGSTIVPLQERLNAGARAPLLVLMVAAALLLVTACSNLAGALLARGTARSGELAIRSALGATRRRLVRQLLTETIVLSVGGALLGVGMAVWIVRLVAVAAPGVMGMADLSIDGRVLGFTAFVTLVTAGLCGLMPALRIADGQATTQLLREGSRGTLDVGRLRAWRVLVAAEVALAVVLLSGSMLMIRSYQRVMEARLGFDPSNVMTAEVNLPSINYEVSSPRVAAFHESVLAGLGTGPAGTAVGFANLPPLGGNNMSGSLELEGKPLDPRGAFNAYALYRVVGGGYFAAAGIPLVRGRAFQAADGAAAPAVVVVNEAMAAAQWPGEDPIGKRLRPAGMDAAEEPWATVVGVVGDVRTGSLIDRFRETYYFDHRQRPAYRTRSVTYVMRSTMAMEQVSERMRGAIQTADADVPVETRAMSSLVREASADRRFTMIVLGCFAAAALFLATIGVFAVVSYSVAQRTREIGVRLALGSTPGAVRGLVVLEAMLAVAPGLVIGALLAVGSAGALRSLLYDVAAFDPASLALSVCALAVAALGSSLGPAIHSTRVDPMRAIRGE